MTKGRTHMQAGDDSLRIGYITSRFPHLTETFILTEILTLQELGCDVQVFSSRPPVVADGPIHADAQPLISKIIYSPYLLSRSLWAAHKYFAGRAPKRYFQTILDLTKHNVTNPFALAKAWLIFPKAVYFAKLAEQHAVQHLHASFSSLPAAAAWIMGRLTGLPYSFAARAVDIFGATLQLKNVMLAEKLRAATFVITIHEYGRQVLLERYGQHYADRISVIHSSIDTMKFHPQSRDGKQEEGQIRILSVGRLIEKKGYPYLIQACKLLTKKGYHFRCDIVGRGREESTLRALIDREGLQDAVFLKGWVTQEKLVDLYDDVDIFVSPSIVAKNGDRDGIPVALMEALAMEKPAVSTCVSGIPELIVDGVTGLLVEPRDAVALAEAMERLILSPDLRTSLGKRGRTRVLEEFERVRNGTRLLALIRNSITNSMRSAGAS
jgi:colanic acid/amylovoran biosynthesis glycosyltransferase